VESHSRGRGQRDDIAVDAEQDPSQVAKATTLVSGSDTVGGHMQSVKLDAPLQGVQQDDGLVSKPGDGQQKQCDDGTDSGDDAALDASWRRGETGSRHHPVECERRAEE
jgi:hypothetical protein